MVGRPARRLFVEGGGDDNEALKTECRRGFRKLLEKAGLEGRMPRIVACGGRKAAYDQFCTSMNKAAADDVAVLLVDAEDKVTETSPWKHVEQREGDHWKKPGGATDDDLHLMIECMESWFLADKEALAEFFGQGFREASLPANPKVEEISKSDIYNGLRSASKNTQKGAYGKGSHSFKVLALVDPAKVREAAPSADRLFEHLDKVF